MRGGRVDPSQIAVVIPCYNESKVIAQTISPLLALGYCVVVVDDGSQDSTFAVLKQLPIYSLRHATNFGQGAALQTGVEFVLRYTDAQFIVHFDADGQHRAEEIPEMVRLLVDDKCDVVLGSRFMAGASANVPVAKKVLLRGARLVNYLFTGLSLTDAHNGFRAMTRRAAGLLKLSEPGFTHATEILWLIRQNELRFCEHPTNIRYTEYSMAKGQSIFNSLNILWDLVLIKVLK